MIGDDYGYDQADLEELPLTEFLHETEKAILVRLDDGQKLWIPKQWVSPETAIFEKGDVGTLFIARWWALDNDLGG